jgi:hypothetical protein
MKLSRSQISAEQVMSILTFIINLIITDEWLDAKVAKVPGSILPSSDTPESEGPQIKQCGLLNKH